MADRRLGRRTPSRAPAFDWGRLATKGDILAWSGSTFDREGLSECWRWLNLHLPGRAQHAFGDFAKDLMSGGANRTDAYRQALVWLAEHRERGLIPQPDGVPPIEVPDDPAVPLKDGVVSGASSFEALRARVADLTRGRGAPSVWEEVSWVAENLLRRPDEIDAGSCPSMGALGQLRFAQGNELGWRQLYDAKRLAAKGGAGRGGDSSFGDDFGDGGADSGSLVDRLRGVGG